MSTWVLLLMKSCSTALSYLLHNCLKIYCNLWVIAASILLYFILFYERFPCAEIRVNIFLLTVQTLYCYIMITLSSDTSLFEDQFHKLFIYQINLVSIQPTWVSAKFLRWLCILPLTAQELQLQPTLFLLPQVICM